VVGAAMARSRLQALAARGLTKFVGRSTELTQLDDALEVVRAARGQVVAVVGEPGVGKSRLFWEFTHSPRTEGCRVIEAPSVSYGKATAYLPITELLKVFSQTGVTAAVGHMGERVPSKLLPLDRALEPSLPPLLALLDVPVTDESWARLDPPQRRRRTL